MTEGKDNTVIMAFVNDLVAHGGKLNNIKQVSCDISLAFIKGVEEKLPNAAIVLDRFLVSKVINEVVDKVRKADVVYNQILKGTKYIFLEIM